MRIMIDAGHGGKDSGAVNGRFKESDIALKIALKVGKLLSDRGYCVYYTRNIDIYPPLNERTKLANDLNVDLFISIHCNSATNKYANGIETLCYFDDGKCYDISKQVQKAIIKNTSAKDRGVKIRKDLAVLRDTKMTALLIECGFISNDEELKRLLNDAYQNKIAFSIADNIML